jgi:hypothetical protein
MGSNLRTREIVQLGENESRSMHASIEAGVTSGWHSFEQNIIQHFAAGTITEETAMLYSVNKSTMRQSLDQAKKKLGQDDQTPHNFRLSEHHAAAAKPPPLPGDLKLGTNPPPPVMRPRAVST